MYLRGLMTAYRHSDLVWAVSSPVGGGGMLSGPANAKLGANRCGQVGSAVGHRKTGKGQVFFCDPTHPGKGRKGRYRIGARQQDFQIAARVYVCMCTLISACFPSFPSSLITFPPSFAPSSPSIFPPHLGIHLSNLSLISSVPGIRRDRRR